MFREGEGRRMDYKYQIDGVRNLLDWEKVR